MTDKESNSYSLGKLVAGLLDKSVFAIYTSRDYFIPTEEGLSWFKGRIALPAGAVETNELEGVAPTVPMGLDIGGRREVMLIGGLAAELAKFGGILLAGINVGIGLEELSRAAIIWARSW